MALVVRSRAPSEVKSRVEAGGCEATGLGGEFGAATTAGLSAGPVCVAATEGEAAAGGFVVAVAGFDSGVATISGAGDTAGPIAACGEAGGAGAVLGTSATAASGGEGEAAGAGAGSGVTAATAATGASVGAGLSTAQPAAASEQNTITPLNIMIRPTLDPRARCPMPLFHWLER